MATNTINVKANGYQSTSAYQFRITATFTGNINGDSREVQIVFDTYAHNPGGYKSYSSPRAYIYVTEEGGSETNLVTNKVKNIWPRDEWMEMARYVGYFNGGQTITVKGRYNSNSTTSYLPLNGNHDVTVTLEIPHTASQITSTSSMSYTIGNNISIGVAKYISNSVDTLLIDYVDPNTGSIPLFFSSNYTNGDVLTPISGGLQEIYEKTVQVPYVNLTATLKTYVDGVQIGEDSVLVFRGNLPKDIFISNITINDEIPRVVALTGSQYIIVKNMSDVMVHISYNLRNEGELSHFVVNGIVRTGPYTMILADNNNSSVFTIQAHSKRGFIDTKVIDLSAQNKWVNYQKPTINIVSLKRNTPVDGNVNVQLNGTWFNGNFGQVDNSISLYYRYKKSTDSTWSNWIALGNPTINNNTFSLTEQLSGFNYAYVWNLEFAVNDAYYISQSIKIPGNVQKGVTIWDVGEHDVAFRVPVNIKNGLNVLGTITGPVASSSALGFMSANDKTHLDNLTSSNLIVESNLSTGNISDGYYIKFANGLMVTMQKYTIQNSTSWTAWGGVYSAQINEIKDFPEEFAQVPMVTVTLESAQDRGGFLSTIAQAPATTTSPGGYQLTRGSTTTGTWQYKLNVFAIGFWQNN